MDRIIRSGVDGECHMLGRNRSRKLGAILVKVHALLVASGRLMQFCTFHMVVPIYPICSYVHHKNVSIVSSVHDHTSHNHTALRIAHIVRDSHTLSSP
jgi:hypothetical protein